MVNGEAASSKEGVAERHVRKFKNFVNSERYVPQVFNCDETGRFLKKIYEAWEEAQDFVKKKTHPNTIMGCLLTGQFKIKDISKFR